MATEFITATVESIEITSGFSMPLGYAQDVAQQVEARVKLDDGRTAYVRTGIGRMVYYKAGVMGPAGAEHFHINNSNDQPKLWPWVVESGVNIAVPTKGSIFEGTTAYPHSRPVLVVFPGDRILIRGSVVEKTSAKGNAYLSVTRAQVFGIGRDGETWLSPLAPQAVLA